MTRTFGVFIFCVTVGRLWDEHVSAGQRLMSSSVDVLCTTHGQIRV